MTLWICTRLPVKSLLSVLTRCNSYDELVVGQWIRAWRGLVSSSNSCSWFLLEKFNSHIYTPSEESIAQVWPRIVSISARACRHESWCLPLGRGVAVGLLEYKKCHQQGSLPLSQGPLVALGWQASDNRLLRSAVERRALQMHVRARKARDSNFS